MFVVGVFFHVDLGVLWGAFVGVVRGGGSFTVVVVFLVGSLRCHDHIIWIVLHLVVVVRGCLLIVLLWI